MHRWGCGGGGECKVEGQARVRLTTLPELFHNVNRIIKVCNNVLNTLLSNNILCILLTSLAKHEYKAG